MKNLSHMTLAALILLGVSTAPALADSYDDGLMPPPPQKLPGIVGHDDRVPYDSTAWPWQAIGRVNQPEAAGHCTGTLIRPDTVLTAAHCVFNQKTGQWLKPEDLVFVAGLRRDEDAGFARGKRIQRSAQGQPRPNLDTMAHDWAVITLEHSLPVRPVQVATVPSLNPRDIALMHFETAGYAQDRPYLLSLDDGCTIKSLAHDNQVLVTDCDSTKGDSGAPLLLRQGKDYRVVGVFSASTAAGSINAGSFAVNASIVLPELSKD